MSVSLNFHVPSSGLRFIMQFWGCLEGGNIRHGVRFAENESPSIQNNNNKALVNVKVWSCSSF